MTPPRAASAERATGELSSHSEVQDDAVTFDHDSIQPKARKVRE
jgi:hypothetical protein